MIEVLHIQDWLTKNYLCYDGYDPKTNTFINPHYNDLKGGYGGNYTKEFLLFLNK